MNWKIFLQQNHANRRKKNLWRNRQILNTPQQPGIRFYDSGKELLNFSSNDYLGLANHLELVKTTKKAVADWGAGSGASHLVSGHQLPHHDLEFELADFVGAEKALLFSTGYMANLAIPSVFLGRNDTVVQDKLNHASLLDAAQLSPAKLKRYRHVDVQHASTLLSEVADNKSLLSTDGVFSMDGDVAPLSELKQLCDQYNTLLAVDDAHGLGVLGKHGRGSLELHGLSASDHVLQVGTLGKAFGSFGAFVAADQLLIEHLLQYARPYIYTTALPAPVVEASRTALKIIKREDWRRQKLMGYVDYFKRQAKQVGLNLMPSDTPIQPLVIGDEKAVIKASEYLQVQGFYVTAIRPPTVAVGSARLRITFSAAHEQEHIDKLLDCLSSKTMCQILSQVENS